MKKGLKETAKRYASKLFIDIKREPLFGLELVEYIRASIAHDTSKSYHTEEFLYLCEDYVIEKYEKYSLKYASHNVAAFALACRLYTLFGAGK